MKMICLYTRCFFTEFGNKDFYPNLRFDIIFLSYTGARQLGQAIEIPDFLAWPYCGAN